MASQLQPEGRNGLASALSGAKVAEGGAALLNRTRGASIEITVRRREVTVRSRSGCSTHAALLWVVPEDGRPAIASVGEDEESFTARLQGLEARGDLSRVPTVHRSGTSAWWDEQWAWPPLEDAGAIEPPPADGDSVLVLWPLLNDSWSPAFAESLLRYCLHKSTSTVQRLLPVLRPKLIARFEDDFTSLEQGELLDALERAWGGAVRCTRPVERAPLSWRTVERWCGRALGVTILAMLCSPAFDRSAPILIGALVVALAGARRYAAARSRLAAPRRGVERSRWPAALR
jgi:hypothetical protein